ncbi:amidohydrolase [Colletotrichum zoysiae]|uniref:6-methylsalicylate decarboxylase n=1 Tax=Colletotrichum zoysiae TaxID=1216348 RepID=A0AAD9H2W9_9PEZI|nr:amidohydrolase [Colletotrichum zoysiae]
MRRTLFFGCFFALEAVASCSSTPSTAKIDAHAHFLPDFYAQALRDAGHLPGPDGMPGIPEWSPEAHLSFMESQNIEKSYLSISSPGVYLVNEYASRLKAEHPGRFGFFASLPLPDVAASVAEIAHCFGGRLDPPPDGVVLMSNAYGLYLGDPAMDPVYAALDALNATVFEHPAVPCTESNHRRYHIDGADPGIAPDEWMALNRPVDARQGRAPTLDFPFETARTFADLLYSAVPTRFPGIEWIMPHAGGALVPTLDRIVGFASPALNLTEASVRAALERSFYFDLAGPWPAASAIPALMRWVSHERIVWGSDVPFTPWAAAGLGAARFDVEVAEVFGNSTDDAQDVRKGNAARLFG